MGLILDAACGCNTGKVRKNNEDNFFFNKSCLDLENCGLQDTIAFSSSLNKKHFFAVFDGMGGENFGEVASFTAAATMKNEKRTFSELFISDEKYLQKLTDKLNNAIVEKKKELLTNRCGSTMVALYFSKKKVYTINVGDSRAYRLREGKLSQLSVDHVVKLPEGTRKKAPLTTSSQPYTDFPAFPREFFYFPIKPYPFRLPRFNAIFRCGEV